MAYAILTATGITVICPHCREPQPNHQDGSHIWSAQQIRDYVGREECYTCGKAFTLPLRDRISISPA